MGDHTPTEEASRCVDCGIPIRFRARVFDLHKDRYVRVYHCPTCRRLYWDE